MLRIDNHNANVGLWTPLGLPGDSAADLSGDHLFISGTNVVVVPEHEMPVLANRVTLWNGALLTHQACTADRCTIDLTVEATDHRRLRESMCSAVVDMPRQ